MFNCIIIGRATFVDFKSRWLLAFLQFSVCALPPTIRQNSKNLSRQPISSQIHIKLWETVLLLLLAIVNCTKSLLTCTAPANRFANCRISISRTNIDSHCSRNRLSPFALSGSSSPLFFATFQYTSSISGTRRKKGAATVASRNGTFRVPK